MALTKEQALHLNQRISNRHGEIRYYVRDKKPAAVVKAEQVVAAFDKAQRDKADAHTAKVTAARTHAQEIVLQGDWDAALAAVKKFETTKF